MFVKNRIFTSELTFDDLKIEIEIELEDNLESPK